MFEICRFKNTCLNEVASTIQTAGRLQPNGLLTANCDPSPENRRRALLAARQNNKLLLSAADVRAAEELKDSLLEEGMDENVWYIQLPELLAIEINLASALTLANGQDMYLEQLQDGRLCMHLPADTADNDENPQEIIVLFPNNHGMAGDTGLEAMLVMAGKTIRFALPEASGGAVQTVACLYQAQAEAQPDQPQTPAEPSADAREAVDEQPVSQPESPAEDAVEAVEAPPKPESQEQPPQPANDCWWLL